MVEKVEYSQNPVVYDHFRHGTAYFFGVLTRINAIIITVYLL